MIADAMRAGSSPAYLGAQSTKQTQSDTKNPAVRSQDTGYTDTGDISPEARAIAKSSFGALEPEQQRFDNSHGDSVHISDIAREMYSRNHSNSLGTTDAENMTFEEFMEYSRTNVNPEIMEQMDKADRQTALQPNWKSFSNSGRNLLTFFDMQNTGALVFESGLGDHIPLRSLEREIAPGKSANIQEKEILAQATKTRKIAFDKLQTAMKRSGIELKQGQKIDFVMDQNGNIKIDPESAGDKNTAAKIENLIRSDAKTAASIRDYLHVSLASPASTPAEIRMHVDSVLKEYTGKGFDDLEWDSEGTLVTPDGFESANQEFPGFGSMVGHLKSLQESEGEGIFKKEFSFSVTASGIIGDEMSTRAGSNLFKNDKMFDNKMYYTDEPMRGPNGDILTKTDTAGNTVNVLNAKQQKENYQEDFLGMKALERMIQEKGTSVYIMASGDGDHAVDANGNRRNLPYQSPNYNATAQYLIEDYLIENGIEGNVSDYALKIDKKGSYEIVRTAAF